MASKKRKLPEGEEVDYIAKPPKHLANVHLKNQEKRLIIVLEKAQLESAKVFYHYNCINTSCLYFVLFYLARKRF